MIFVEYPTCSTCRKAKKFLEAHHLTFTDRHILEDTPTIEELKAWIARSGKETKKFFNTSGRIYKEEHLKERLPNCTEEEKLEMLAAQGMLIKRPILVLPTQVLVGFKESEWLEALKKDNLL